MKELLQEKMVKRCLLFESSSSENEEENEGGVEKVKHKMTDHKAMAEEEEESDDDDDNDVSFKIIYRTDAVEEEEVLSPLPSPSSPPKKKRVVKAAAMPKKRRGILKWKVVRRTSRDPRRTTGITRFAKATTRLPSSGLAASGSGFANNAPGIMPWNLDFLFHELLEFDGSKRTCRKSLEAHNKRRRKFVTLPELDDVDTELVLGFQDSKNNSRMTVDQSGKKRKTDLLLRPTFKHFKLR
ncbi:putative squamosa promoter-binding-like protein 19 [Acorus calamus]|uniref:Squamosa promoter-binding-like protein 19 n=1 Tax=Acorus calamus TaxID=4465 RepID=A0AAV9DQX1_ACOCL|nr:putative squamosa promoter-binding-like protein 19 [Acorus calamus]